MTGAKVALVTGASSGIGRATALELHRQGFVVYATARNVAGLDDLVAGGTRTVGTKGALVPLPMDVTDEESMASAIRTIESEHEAVDVLVDNAGFELVGPVEEVPIGEVRKLFDTNVFGLIRLTQLAMRRRRRGRIINVASICGRLAVPGGAFYGASKHAVEGFSAALRLEVARYGIDVALIEPAATRTRLRANTAWFGNRENGPYASFHADLERWRAATYETRSNPAGRLSSTPEQVAAMIVKAATGKRPRARYPVGIIAHALFAMQRLLPAATFEAFVRRQFVTPRPAESR